MIENEYDFSMLKEKYGIELLNHQKKAIIRFGEQNGRLRLWHDAGTGKSYIFLSILLMLKETNPDLKCMLVCTLTLIESHWNKIIKNYDLWKNVTCINYEYLLYHTDMIDETIDIIIFDEDHKIANYFNKTYKNVRKAIVESKTKWLIGGSGTPMPREFDDFYAPYSIYYYEENRFSDYYEFALTFGRYNPYTYKYNLQKSRKKEFNILLEKYCDIAKKKECYDLPEVYYQNYQVRLTDEQSKLINDNLGFELEEYVRMNSGVRMLRKRQICCDYYLVDDKEKEIFIKKKWDNKEKVIKELLELMEKPVIIWGCFRYELENIYDYLKDIYKCALWYGGTKDVDIESFQKNKIEVLIAHPASVGIGLNLQNCSNVIYNSLDWGVINYEQSLSRVIRKGQNKKVTVCFISYEDTIEEYVSEKLSQKIVNYENLCKEVKKITEKELFYLEDIKNELQKNN